MSGTEWTEPGQGAMVRELKRALGRLIHASVLTGPGPGVLAAYDHAHSLALGKGGYRPDMRTNLRLTGQPLTAEDVKNISEAK